MAFQYGHFYIILRDFIIERQGGEPAWEKIVQVECFVMILKLQLLSLFMSIFVCLCVEQMWNLQFQTYVVTTTKYIVLTTFYLTRGNDLVISGNLTCFWV